MTHHPLARLLAVASFSAALPSAALAQDSSYFFGGLSIGQARSHLDTAALSNGLLGTGLATTLHSADQRDTAYKLFGGYQFSPWLGVEAGYFNLGDFSFRSTTSPAGTLDGHQKVRGWNLDLVATMPITERLSLLARVGAQQAQVTGRFSGTGAVSVADPSLGERKTNPKLGVALQYAFSPGFLVRGEAERYRLHDSVGRRGDVDLYSVSLVFPFGRAPAAATPRPVAQYVAPPPVVAPPPPPPPVVVAPPPPAPAPMAPERRRVSFEADSLFGFDQSTVRPEGRAALDTLAREAQGTRFEVITVEGHTDRLGSTAYNLALSQRRAEVVKAYLVAAGLDASKLNAVGQGESMPLTTADACKGTRASPALVLCLQPDRRVEVEVTGTR